MENFKIREKLYNKMDKEFKKYIKELKKYEKEYILNNVYQIFVKEEIVSIFYPEYRKYNMNLIKSLNKTRNPLELLYQGWMDSDVQLTKELEDNVYNTLEELNKIQKKKNKNRDR